MDDKHKATYWELRALYNEQHSHDKANQAVPTIINAYIRAQNYLTGEVNQIYRRYFTDGDYTEAEAKQILNTTVSPTELVTLRALANNVSDKESKKQVNKYLSSIAAKGRITRLEELKAKSYIAAKQAASVELKTSTDLYTDVIQDAFNQLKDDGLIGSVGKDVELPRTGQSSSEGTNVHIVSNPKSGKEITRVGTVPDTPITEFKELSGKYVKAALDTPWYGRNFSQRIWHNTDKLAERVNELFTAQQMSGMRERDMAKALADEFGASMARAKTLIRTEANYFHNKTNLDSWKQRGVKQYKLVAVLDMRTSKFCRNIDGEVIDVNRAEIGLTFPPFHPNCRTIAVIYLPNSQYKFKRTANDPISGGTFKLDANATYRDWEQAIIDRHSQFDFDLKRYEVKNYSRDVQQYRSFQADLADENMPVSFDNFQNMKYRNGKDWKELISYHNQRVSGLLSPQMNFKDYHALHELALKQLVGLTTSDGHTVKSLSQHFMERLIGSSNSPLSEKDGKTESIRSGVHIDDIKEALLYGKVEPSHHDKTVNKYTGKHARVTLNFITGNIVQVNPIGKRKK